MIDFEIDNDPRLTRIVSDPTVLGGKPVIRGKRVPVSFILHVVAHGYSIERIVDAYPIVNTDDVRAALRYAEGLSSRTSVPSLKR